MAGNPWVILWWGGKTWHLLELVGNSGWGCASGGWIHHKFSRAIWDSILKYFTDCIRYTVPNLNLSIKTEPVRAGANATVYVWLLLTHIWPRKQTTNVASALTVTGLVLMWRSGLFLGQCSFMLCEVIWKYFTIWELLVFTLQYWKILITWGNIKKSGTQVIRHIFLQI